MMRWKRKHQKTFPLLNKQEYFYKEDKMMCGEQVPMLKNKWHALNTLWILI